VSYEFEQHTANSAIHLDQFTLHVGADCLGNGLLSAGALCTGNKLGLLGYDPGKEGSVSEYGASANFEDFAESWRYYVLGDDEDMSAQQNRQRFFDRYIDAMKQEGSKQEAFTTSDAATAYDCYPSVFPSSTHQPRRMPIYC
jgi:hypothetical protein